MRPALLLLVLATAVHAQHGVLGHGTRWETPWHVVDSGKPGPTVAIVGGAHGNEPAGAYAADQIRRWPITRGKLVVVPRANPPALKVYKRYTPGVPKTLRNLNRNYGDPPRGRQAPRIWALLKRHAPDWVLDLHEGFDFHNVNDRSVGSTVIVANNAVAEGKLLVAAANTSILRKSRAFLLLHDPAPGSLAQAAAKHLGAKAMSLETTTKYQSLAFRARQHRVMVHRLLRHLGMIGRDVTADRMTSRDKRTKVALYASTGTGGAGVPRILGQLRGREDVEIERVCITDIRAGVLDQFDCVIFSGGSGGGQGRALGAGGRERVRAFVKAGGGYVGICAGAYLATSGFSWGLKILDAKTKSSRWRRGRAIVKMEMTDEGRRIFESHRNTRVIYHNGPILKPAGVEGLEDYRTLAWFRTEVARYGSPRGIMKDSPAIVAGRCGKGRVMCISPHPEQTDTMENWIHGAVGWVTRR